MIVLSITCAPRPATPPPPRQASSRLDASPRRSGPRPLVFRLIMSTDELRRIPKARARIGRPFPVSYELAGHFRCRGRRGGAFCVSDSNPREAGNRSLMGKSAESAKNRENSRGNFPPAVCFDLFAQGGG